VVKEPAFSNRSRQCEFGLSIPYTESMTLHELVLTGQHVRLEPLTLDHIEPLAAASAGGTPTQSDDLYNWTVVPQGIEEATTYVKTALQWRDEGTAVPFAIVRQNDNAVIGSTRFFEAEYWAWPAGHERYGNPYPDVAEIGYTWFARSAVRTGANSEAKFLMLQHAFEVWKSLRICLKTDLRNLRSQAAMERLGCRREGILRAQKLAPDFTVRDSVRYSIIAAEWPDTKQHILSLMRPA
jgi:N-acetyltransferase